MESFTSLPSLTVLRDFLSFVSFLIGGWLVLLNWQVAWQVWVVRKNAPSWIPILGGALIAFGLWLQPDSAISSRWWIGFLIDYGCFLGFAHTAWFWMVYFWASKEEDKDAR